MPFVTFEAHLDLKFRSDWDAEGVFALDPRRNDVGSGRIFCDCRLAAVGKFHG